MYMRFTVYGERCSGTNYLEELMLANFNIVLTWDYGWKHFFGFHTFNNNDAKENDTIFIGIVRHPIEWLCSFHNQPHHVPEINKSWANFLTKPFFSVRNTDEDMMLKASEKQSKVTDKLSINTQAIPLEKNKVFIKQDVNIVTKAIYKNIFELRCIKNYYLLNEMPKNAKNYILINYEDLRDNTEAVIKKIGSKFNLQMKNENVKNITYYKKDKDRKYDKKFKHKCDREYIEYMKSQLHQAQELRLGYHLF